MSIRSTFMDYSFATPATSPMTKGASRKATIAAISALGLGSEGWTWGDDLALVEAACTGQGFAAMAGAFDCKADAVRNRWHALTRAACPEGQPFGLDEQEALLIALRHLVQGGEA